MQFIKKTSSRGSIIGIITKLAFISVIIFLIIFLLNKIDFPAPKKEIEKGIDEINLNYKNQLSFTDTLKCISFRK